MVFENGKEYANEGREWRSDRSLEEKTRRCGIVEKSKGSVELCWGQGPYGDHVYTVSYVIDNLVQSYPECDGFHWHFLNDEWSTRPQHASIRIENQTDLDPWFHESADSCNVRFWGFGMVGDSRMNEDGSIFFESAEPFRYKSFFSALVAFDKGLFHPQVEADGTFEELKKEAMKGSDYKSEKEIDFEEILFRIVVVVLFIIPFILLVGLVIFLIIRRLYRRISGNRYDRKIFGRSKIDTWCRDVPFDGNPSTLFSLLQSGDFLHADRQKAFSNVVGAYFLKWIQEGLVRVEKDPYRDQRVNLRFVKKGEDVPFDDKVEGTVYKAAVKAAGGNALLEADEFKDWSYNNDFEVRSWPNEAVSAGRAVWQKLNPEERAKAVEFKNFLEDFTLMGEREAPEVGLWKKYMIVASALGIADKVARNFEKLFPEVMERYAAQTNMTDTMTTYYVLDGLRNSSTSLMKAAENARLNREAAASAERRRSGGGGGSISFGGGGGGFGGGHGGGSR